MSKPKVYIVDDSLIFRAMLETMIARDPGFELCGMASSADEARSKIGWLLPDIVLLDLNMPGTPGLDFLEELTEHWHHMDVIVISSDTKQGSDVCKTAFRRGAAACFDKARVIMSGRHLLELMHDLGSDSPIDSHLMSRAITLPGAHYI